MVRINLCDICSNKYLKGKYEEEEEEIEKERNVHLMKKKGIKIIRKNIIRIKQRTT